MNKCSPPPKKAGMADFKSALMSSLSVEYDACSSECDDAANPKESPLFARLGKTPTAKIFNDSIHGPMQFPPALIAIIDTKQFARLRKLKQLGTCQYIYPNASHSRFEHSLGVGYLAGKFARHLRSKYSHLVSEKDVLCIMIAGACHDLGHGPFSHLWENFIRAARPGLDYHHEDTSILMFEHLLSVNNLRPVLKELAGIEEQDITFIKEQIAGVLDEATNMPTHEPVAESGKWPYRGRGEEKSFLYEIVANKVSGIDVDKWDYFLRDDYHTKVGHVFNYERFILFSRVEKMAATSRRHIIIRDKELENLKHMVEDRSRLHTHAYQHRVTKIVDRMMVDAWLIADKHIRFRSSQGELLALADTCTDIGAHESIYDSNVNSRIEDSEDPAVEPAKVLLNRIERRDFYQAVCTVDVSKLGPESVRNMTAKQILDEIKSFVCSEEEGGGDQGQTRPLRKDDFTAFTNKITAGVTTDKILVYHKGRTEDAVKVTEVSLEGEFDNIKKEMVFVLVKERLLAEQAADVIRKWMEFKGLM